MSTWACLSYVLYQLIHTQPGWPLNSYSTTSGGQHYLRLLIKYCMTGNSWWLFFMPKHMSILNTQFKCLTAHPTTSWLLLTLTWEVHEKRFTARKLDADEFITSWFSSTWFVSPGGNGHQIKHNFLVAVMGAMLALLLSEYKDKLKNFNIPLSANRSFP